MRSTPVPVNYPVHWCNSGESQGELVKFKIRPALGAASDYIEDHPDRISYKSSIKPLPNCKDCLNVFHYTFEWPQPPSAPGSRHDLFSTRRPGATSWSVMWDYENGLVRTTAFFKSLGYPKTEPKKAISATEGLEKFCHSITGGRVEAQGYWIPFQAARELAMNFTYEIRYALVPIFGPDFPELCLTPEDPVFKRWKLHNFAIPSSQYSCHMKQIISPVTKLEQKDNSPVAEEFKGLICTTNKNCSKRGTLKDSESQVSQVPTTSFLPVNHKQMNGRKDVHNNRLVPRRPRESSTNDDDFQRKSDIKSTKRRRSSSSDIEQQAQPARCGTGRQNKRVYAKAQRIRLFEIEEIQVAQVLTSMKYCGAWYLPACRNMRS